MKLSDFDYQYPEGLVAQRPLLRRDASRMMVVDRAAKTFAHSRVLRLPDLLKEGDVLVLNDSKVFPARLFGKRESGKPLELLVVEDAGGGKWRCMVKNAARMKDGERIKFGEGAEGVVAGRYGIFVIVNFAGDSLNIAIKNCGVPPLPPYITREGYDSYTNEDRERYQTVYAQKTGSTAAPTAGLHLSETLLQEIKSIGVIVAFITLHVGIDTFAPVRVENVAEHKMHGEWFEITKQTAETIAAAKEDRRRIIAVGTTTTRALETAARTEGNRSELFITPGFEFLVVDGMLTNFHQPRSTLLIMVSAFAGREFVLKCYREAISKSYRLFSYGDCMFIR